MAKTEKNSSGTGVVVLLTVIFLLVAGVCAYNLALGLLGKEAVATVTDMKTSEKTDSDNNDRTYELTVSYSFKADGEIYTGTVTYTARKPINVIQDNVTKELTAPGYCGSTLKVVYMPGNPKRNMPSDQVAFKGGGTKSAVIQIGLIVLMPVLCVVVILLHIRKRRRGRAGR